MADGGSPIKARYEAGYPSEYNASPPAAQSGDAEIYAAGQRLREPGHGGDQGAGITHRGPMEQVQRLLAQRQRFRRAVLGEAQRRQH